MRFFKVAKFMFPLLIVGLLLIEFSATLPNVNAIGNGLVGYWRFDSSGVDSSGNGNTGTLTSATYGTGVYGSCVNFTNGYLTVPTSSSLQLTGDFSICFWVNSKIPLNGDGNIHDVLVFRTGTNKLLFRIENAGGWDLLYNTTVGSFPPLSFTKYTDSWVCVCIVKTGVNLNIYENSTLVSSVSNFGNLSTGDFTFTVGGFSAVQSFIGLVDELRIYNRVLNSQEISELYMGYYVTVSTDLGSTVNPNGTINVGAGQSQSFTVGATAGYAPWSYYLDGVPYASSSVITINGLQANHTLYITSQYIGGASVSPTPTDTPISESGIGTAEIILILLFAFFTVSAFWAKDALLYGLAGFLSLILGIDLAVVTASDSSAWAFSIIGFALILFGIALPVIGIDIILTDKKKKGVS